MTDPKAQQQQNEKADELDVDAETVRDLEVRDDDGKDVKGGYIRTCQQDVNCN
jgi:hypothetical protein